MEAEASYTVQIIQIIIRVRVHGHRTVFNEGAKNTLQRRHYLPTPSEGSGDKDVRGAHKKVVLYEL